MSQGEGLFQSRAWFIVAMELPWAIGRRASLKSGLASIASSLLHYRPLAPMGRIVRRRTSAEPVCGFGAGDSIGVQVVSAVIRDLRPDMNLAPELQREILVPREPPTKLG
jgi:hypothetical protein